MCNETRFDRNIPHKCVSWNRTTLDKFDDTFNVTA